MTLDACLLIDVLAAAVRALRVIENWGSFVYGFLNVSDMEGLGRGEDLLLLAMTMKLLLPLLDESLSFGLEDRLLVS